MSTFTYVKQAGQTLTDLSLLQSSVCDIIVKLQLAFGITETV